MRPIASVTRLLGRLRGLVPSGSSAGDGIRYESAEAYGQLDPRLQRLVERRKRVVATRATVSVDEVEVPVIARVTSAAGWEAMNDVRAGANLGKTEDGSEIVTGRIPVTSIETVRQHDVVRSLKQAQRLRPMLSASTEETNAAPNLLPEDARGNQGAGVIAGFVDGGCDFAHENFRNENGSSRVAAIWDQSGPTSAESPFGYGRLITGAEIDAALQQGDPYTALRYGPDPDSPGRRGAHGTHVMDIAAGNGRGSNVPGFAPRASILFVEPANSDIPWEGPQVVEADFGDSAQLLEAIRFIFDQADDTPCVVNVSLGTNGGPHDGTSLVEQGIDAMLSERENRAVVIAASNSFEDGIHAAGSVHPGESVDLGWVVPDGDFTQNEAEIWYSGDDEFELELLIPDGTSVGTVPLGESGSVTDDNGRVLLFVSHRKNDPNNGDNVVGVFLEAGLPEGTWTLRLHGKAVTNGAFHAWIERDDANQSSFAPPHDNSHTLGSISCGHETLVAGSYDAHVPGRTISSFSSAGPTRDGRQKPEVSAPGHKVLAAHSRTGTGVVPKSGTSMAAPAVSGIVALLLAEARARGATLPVAKIRSALDASARSDPPPAGPGWDPRYGRGRIDAKAAIVDVIAGIDAGPANN